MKRTSIMMILIASFFINSCSNNKTSSLKLAHGLDTTHPVHKAMVFMAKKLNEISNGQMSIEIYPGGQLGGEQQCVELLQIGSLAMTKVSAAVLESFTPNYQILGLPYIFRNREHAFKVLDGPIGKGFLNSTLKYNIKGLCFYDAGARSFYSVNKPINKTTDLSGMKIRVMKSQTAMNMVQQMGGSPTPISWGELYTALQSGVVDGAENNPPSFYTSHHYEVCKYYSINEHTIVPDVLIISKVIWDKLSEQQKKWVKQAATESVEVERKLWAEAETKAINEVKKAGVNVIYPDKTSFSEAVKNVFDKYKTEPKLFEIIQKIRNTK